MTKTYESMLRATDPQSVLALLREFLAEANNVQAHLRSIEAACEKECAGARA